MRLPPRLALLGANQARLLPPHLIVDLGVGRDRVLARYQRVGETDEARLLLGIARGIIRAVGRDFVEADVLLLPVGQGELELLPTPDGWR